MFGVRMDDDRSPAMEWGNLPRRAEFLERFGVLSGAGFAVIMSEVEQRAIRSYKLARLASLEGLIFTTGKELYEMLEEVVQAEPSDLRHQSDWDTAMCIVETILAVYGYRWTYGLVGDSLALRVLAGRRPKGLVS